MVIKEPALLILRSLLIPILLFMAALIPRVYGLSETGVHMDEVIWMTNSKTYIYGFRTLFVNQLETLWWNNTNETYAIGIPTILVSGVSLILFGGSSRFSLHLLSDVTASRLPMVIIGSLFSPYVFYALTKLVSRRLAFLAALGYALSPVSIALDRWLLHDSSLTIYSFIALCQFLIYWKERRSGFIPGLALGMAFLSKPHGLLVVIAWIVIIISDSKNHELRKLFIKSTIGFFIVIAILWPQVWYHPLNALPEYLSRQIQFAQADKSNFYLGKVTTDPGWSYYLFQLLTQLPEVIIIGFSIGVVSFQKWLRSNRDPKTKVTLVSIGAYFLIFLIGISISSKKIGLRYALPLLPWIYAISALGIIAVLKTVSKASISLIIVIILSIISLLWPLTYFPNFQIYRNLLTGGPVNVIKYDRISLCVGNKKALEYLDRNAIDGSTYIFGCADAGPYHSGRTLTKDFARATIFIVETAAQQVDPNNQDLKRILQMELIYTVSENGIETARLYRRTTTTNPDMPFSTF